MKRWTVQCSFAAYDANTVVVDADTLEEALGKAIAKANESDGWFAIDLSGNTFVDAAAVGDDADPWKEFESSLPIPARFTERGEPPRITIYVSGGVVQNVEIEGGTVRVEIRDYDTDGADDPNIQTDADGKHFTLADWSNDLPPEHPADAPRAGTRASNPER
jgi:hypothetical protein